MERRTVERFLWNPHWTSREWILQGFNWKIIAGSVAGFLTLVALFLLVLRVGNTPHQGTTLPASSKSQSAGSAARPDSTYFSSHAATVDRPKRWSSSRQSASRNNESASGSNRSEKLLVEDLPVYWPAGIGPDDLPPWMRGQPEVYLEEIEDARNDTPSEQRTPENRTVLFTGAQPDLISGYPYSDVVFDPSVTRLYAWFSCDTAAFSGRTKVLAKWTQEDSTEILFEGMSILNSTPYNYIWWEDSFWSPGRYSVEVYGLDDEVQLLAWGTYEIADLSEHTSFAGLYGDPLDQVSRQSFYLAEEEYLKVNYSSTQERQIQILITRVADGKIVNGGLVSFPPGMDRDFTVSLTDLANPFEPGSYVLELFSYPEPQSLMGRNVFNILE